MAHKVKCRPYYDDAEGVWRVAWFGSDASKGDKMSGRYKDKSEASRAASLMNRTFSVLEF